MSGEAVPAVPSGGACVSPLTGEERNTCRCTKTEAHHSQTPLYTDLRNTDIDNPEAVGTTLGEAVRQYKAHRKGEAANGAYGQGTKHGRAQRRYATIANFDRWARANYSNPSVAMLTPTGDPSMAPVDQAEAVKQSLNNVIEQLRQYLGNTRWEYVTVRGYGPVWGAHIHILVWVDGRVTPKTFAPAVQSHVNNCDIATAEQHPVAEAVKVDTAPSRNAKPVSEHDEVHGCVSPLARYVATQLPHIAPVGQLSEAEARQGAIEMAAPSCGFSSSSGISITAVGPNPESTGDSSENPISGQVETCRVESSPPPSDNFPVEASPHTPDTPYRNAEITPTLRRGLSTAQLRDAPSTECPHSRHRILSAGLSPTSVTPRDISRWPPLPCLVALVQPHAQLPTQRKPRYLKCLVGSSGPGGNQRWPAPRKRYPETALVFFHPHLSP